MLNNHPGLNSALILLPVQKPCAYDLGHRRNLAEWDFIIDLEVVDRLELTLAACDDKWQRELLPLFIVPRVLSDELLCFFANLKHRLDFARNRIIKGLAEDTRSKLVC